MFSTAAFCCLEAGVFTGVLALATGLIDLLRIDKDKKQAIATAIIHGFINLTVLLVFAIFAYKAWQQYPQMTAPQLPALLVKTIMIMVLFVGNYLGGRLIIHYQIGIKKET